MHKRRYRAEDTGGARLVSGRYNRGLDGFPEGETFPALLPAPHARAAALPERFPLSKLLASVRRVVDYRDPNPPNLASGDLSHDTDYRATQALGTAADRCGLEGLLVRSATDLGDNLILFPQNFLAGLRLRVVSGRDPRLSVTRD